MFPGLSLSPVVDRYVLSSSCQSVTYAASVGWYIYTRASSRFYCTRVRNPVRVALPGKPGGRPAVLVATRGGGSSKGPGCCLTGLYPINGSVREHNDPLL